MAEKESGGITQHIGAYQIEEKGKKITFLDTPGHEAFSQMRSRGAKVADIAILVIDATKGVQAQTKEVISHIKKAGLPTIVALNKIDISEANSEKARRELAKEDILLEGVGGKVPSVEVSARTGKGIPELLELILLMAEMEEGLKTDIQKSAEGVVVESYSDNLRGPTATLLLTAGILKAGDIIGTPSAWTKIKSLESFQKLPLEKAMPSDPVIVFGFNQVPKVGEEFKVFPDSESAESHLQASEVKPPKVVEISEGKQVLNLILKADVLGSIEAIEGILRNLPQEKVALRILKSEVGDINESDVKLAKGGRALVLGFRVKTDAAAKKISERDRIKIMPFEIIYDLVEGVRKFMEKILAPEETRLNFGKIKVLATFTSEKNRQVVGGRAIEGEIKRGTLIEVFRNEEKVGQGKLVNLQRNKKDIELITKGDECGILFEGDAKIETGDILLSYSIERRKGEL